MARRRAAELLQLGLDQRGELMDSGGASASA
jgi:hypothetical protein